MNKFRIPITVFILICTVSPLSLFSEGNGGASDLNTIAFLNALYSDGKLKDILNFDETISLPDSPTARKKYTAYVYYLKGKAAETLGYYDDAAYFYKQVRKTEQGMNSDSRLLTLLSEVSLLPMLANGEEDTAVAVLAEIILLKKELLTMLPLFVQYYGLLPPDEETINSRIGEVISPYFSSVTFGGAEMLTTSLFPGKQGEKPGIMLVYHEGYFRVIYNKTFSSKQAALNFGNNLVKKDTGLSFIIKTYGESQYGIQFGAFEDLYRAYQKAVDTDLLF